MELYLYWEPVIITKWFYANQQWNIHSYKEYKYSDGNRLYYYNKYKVKLTDGNVTDQYIDPKYLRKNPINSNT